MVLLLRDNFNVRVLIMKSKFIGLITVRVSSSRLPRKALVNIGNKRLIDHIIDRAKLSLNNGLDKIVICTSTREDDDILERIAKESGVDCYRGSLEDKINRWMGAAAKYNADYLVTIDGDDPFCDPELIKLAIRQIKEDNLDVVTADTPEYACGGFTHCFSTKTLRKICEVKKTNDTEMTKPYLIDRGMFKVGLLKTDPVFKDPNIRLTLDYPEDLEFFRRVFEEMKMKKNHTPLREILVFLHSRPDLVNINFFRQKDFASNQQRLEKIEFNK